MGFWGGGNSKSGAAEKKKEEQEKAREGGAAAPGQNAKAAPDVSLSELPPPTVTPPLSQETSVFEFGSAANGEDKITLGGYCPISDGLEPCRWEVLPSGGSEAPQFRIIF